MKKILSGLLVVLLIVSAISVSAETVGTGWVNDLSSKWAINNDKSISTVKSGSTTVLNYALAFNNKTKYDDNFEVEVDLQLVYDADYVTVTLNAGAVSAYAGTMIKVDGTYGLTLLDIDTKVTVAPEYAGKDTLAGFDANKDYQHIKIKKENKKVSVWVNGVLSIENQEVKNCDASGMILLGAQIHGDKTCTFKNFKFTKGDTVIKEFTVDAETSSVVSQAASETVSSAPASSTASNTSSTAASTSSTVTSGTSSVAAKGGCGNKAK